MDSRGLLWRLLSGPAAAFTVWMWTQSVHAQELPPFMAYSAQVLCLDEAGNPTTALPIDESCVRSRVQRSDDIAIYRKHDWPNSLSEPTLALGYQASDSVVERRASRTIVVQTFDFGTDGRVFGRFDGGHGDGGQVLLFIGDWASFAMTEDGGGGVQWFIGETCRSPVDQDARFLSWLVFASDVHHNLWRTVVARLNITAKPDICPGRFNDAFTRFRFDRVEFPFRIIEQAPSVRTVRRELEVVVSEHYGGTDIATADHLERFYLAKGLGLVRWERWANGNVKQPASSYQAAQLLAQTARCPKVERYGQPDDRWLLVDCRTWTTLVRQTTPWSVRDYRWSALKGLGEAN